MSRKEVIDKTLGEIRSFLDEISNRTSRYRSLHSLTEQVEHQYHGRFLIELIQNAHDALFEVGHRDAQRRVEIILDEDEDPHGTLYIANDGKPFTSSNFEALSNFGQSDKNPQKSIGNKGIGFRSVLEITKAPEIYSRKEIGSKDFDGYCFRFSPCVIKTFETPIRQVVEGYNKVQSPVASEEPLLLWDSSRYERFRSRCKSFEKDWIAKELTFLSPYALPIPMEPDGATSKIVDFEKKGFSTVIRLPLLSKDICELVRKKMAGMNENTVLFLQRLNMLRLVYGDVEKCYLREQKLRKEDKAGGFEVLINFGIQDMEATNKDVISRYWMWSRQIGGVENPEEREKIQNAVVNLPGKWPTVEEATIALAVRVGETPEDGALNIYLPTDVSSGCSAHFSAPFYGNMSRTHVDFDMPFNNLLLRSIAEKTAEVILSSVAGKGKEAASAIIDLISPMENDEGNRWWCMLAEVFSDLGVDIEEENIVLSNQGWNSLSNTRILPEIKPGTVISKHVIRSEATYSIFVESLAEREAGLKRIFEMLSLDSKASPQDNAATVEAIAKKLVNSPDTVDWNGFWIDVENLFSGNTEPLNGRQILLGTDNQLHASDDESTVFFRPRSSGTDDEVTAEGDIDNIPEKLRPNIAFLNECIQVHVPGIRGGLRNTRVHSYLSSGLVETYGVELIFRSVLVKATPKLPSELKGQHSQLCADILQWSLRLLKVSTGSMDEPIRFLRRLPAPCVGGWYPLEETSFGPGWPGMSGTDLTSYYQQVGTTECHAAIERLLLPPEHAFWGEMGMRSVDILKRAGVFNGLRLLPVNSEDWQSGFTIADWKGVKLPENCPPGYSTEMWNSYRNFIHDSESPYYISEFKYEVQEMHRLPGFEKLESFNDVTREIFMKLLLTSIHLWEMETQWENWNRVIIRKIGGDPHRLSPISPLAFCLRETAWMSEKADGEDIRFCPSDRWYIPLPSLIGGLHQFSHLMPMPSSVTSILSGSPDRVNSMKGLGMPIYDPEKETAHPRLLNDLAKALEEPSIDISNMSVFLGQVRSAWGQFHPDGEDVLPRNIIVHNGVGPLRVITPSEEAEAAYLPDASVAVHKGLELHSKPVIAIETKDAKRLKENFRNAFGDGIRFASELTMKPLVDGDQWQEHDNSVQLSDEFPWLIPVVLSVFAFSGGQSRGVGTKTFIKAVDTLRRTRITWVGRLEVGLWHGGLSEARTPVPALWLSNSNILLATDGVRTDMSLLSEALASVVDRNDIDIYLKYALESFKGENESSDDIISSSLSKLQISIDRYQEVQQRWLGDLAWRIRLVRPLILLMQADADTEPLNGVSSDEQFCEFLRSCNLSPLGIDGVLSIVRDAKGFKSVGYKMWEILENRAQLSQWNKILVKAGELAVINDQADEQFQAHLDSVRTMLRSIIRMAIRQNPKVGGFIELDTKLSEVNCPLNYAENYWVVEFQDMLKVILDILIKWNVEPSVLKSVGRATSTKDLHSKLEELGLAPDVDPIGIHADNIKRFRHVLADVQRVAIVWCLRENADEGLWGEDNTIFETQLAEVFTKTAYVDIWDEAMCFQVLKKMNQSQMHGGLWKAINTVSSVDDLMDALGILKNELIEARERLEQRRQKRDIQKKTVNVCGSKFINTEDNLNNLWDHILVAIEDDNVAKADLSALEELRDQSPIKKRKKRDRKPTSKKKYKGSVNGPMEKLVGLAGEIHAYRALQKAYGAKTVGPICWISENSRHKYPENATDDGFGCDFVIRIDKKVHYVEVKASQGEDDTFELGSSEVELAIGTASPSNKEFVILHVLNALGDSPRFRLLPNPYDRKHRGKYHFEEAGLRVRYKLN